MGIYIIPPQDYPSSGMLPGMGPFSRFKAPGGRLLVRDSAAAGLIPVTYEVEWNASDYPSGVYFYRLMIKGYTETKKMVLLK